MNITHIIIGLEVGGAELMLARLIETQRVTAPWLRHRVVSLTSLGEIGGRLRAQGVEVAALGMGSILHGPATLLRLVALLRRQRSDIVQTWMYHADLIGGLAARLAGLRGIIWGIRSTDITKGGSHSTRVVRWLCARLSRRIPQSIVCAANASLKLHAALGYDRTRMLVIPNGLDLARMTIDPVAVAALRDAHGLPGDVVVVGTVGRFSTVKGQEDFVRAAGLIAAARLDCRFMMVGLGCSWDNPRLVGWIRQTGFAERFVLMGKRQDVPVCLAAIDLFALTSRSEGFPNVLAEAMAMGRSCVTTDVGDAALLLGDCGHVVPPENPAAMAEAVLAMLDAGTTARSTDGDAAQARVQAEFSMDRCARRFESLYESVFADHRETG